MAWGKKKGPGLFLSTCLISCSRKVGNDDVNSFLLDWGYLLVYFIVSDGTHAFRGWSEVLNHCLSFSFHLALLMPMADFKVQCIPHEEAAWATSWVCCDTCMVSWLPPIPCPPAQLEWEEVEKLEAKWSLGKRKDWGESVLRFVLFLIILLWFDW